MNENNGHCCECDGNNNNHYSGCSYDGTGKGAPSYHTGGNGSAMAVFVTFFILGSILAAFVPPIGIGLIILGAKITNV